MRGLNAPELYDHDAVWAKLDAQREREEEIAGSWLAESQEEFDAVEPRQAAVELANELCARTGYSLDQLHHVSVVPCERHGMKGWEMYAWVTKADPR